jgi:hypothetical protein
MYRYINHELPDASTGESNWRLARALLFSLSIASKPLFLLHVSAFTDVASPVSGAKKCKKNSNPSKTADPANHRFSPLILYDDRTCSDAAMVPEGGHAE